MMKYSAEQYDQKLIQYFSNFSFTVKDGIFFFMHNQVFTSAATYD